MKRPPRDSLQTFEIRSYRRYGESVLPPSWWTRPDCLVRELKFPAVYERISSDDSSFRGVKPCVHEYYTQNVGLPCRLEGINSYGQAFGEEEIIRIDPLPLIRDLMYGELYQPYSVDWDRLVAKTIPSMKSDFNLINFAWESGEIKDMAKSLDALRKKPAELLRAVGLQRQVVKTVDGKRKVLRSLSPRDLSGTYLGYTFGVTPLASDLATIYDRVKTFGEVLGRNRARLQKGTKCNSRRLVAGTIRKDIDIPGYWYGPHFGELVIDYHGYAYSSCKVQGSIPSDPVREYLDYIGFYPDLSTLWNGLPFSFLIDYLVPISKALESDPWLKPDMQVTDGCYSVKISGTWSVRVRTLRSSDGWTSKYYDEASKARASDLYSNGTFKMYVRDPVRPVLDGIDLPPLFSPKLTQAANVAALIGANFPRSR